MSEHVEKWLNAYLDGEIQGHRLQQIETHLAGCPDCQNDLHRLGNLSQVLRADTLPATLPSPEQLATRVALHLPRQPTPTRQRVAEIGWWLAPAALLSIWVFIQTAFMLSNWIWTVDRLGLLGDAANWLFPSSNYAWLTNTASQLGLISHNTSLQWVSLGEALGWNILVPLSWVTGLALLYLSWLSIWLTRRQHPESG